MDAYIKNITTLKNPSSKMAFGQWSLEPTGSEDLVAMNTFFRRPDPGSAQAVLTVEALLRLLPQTASNLLCLTGSEQPAKELTELQLERGGLKIQFFRFSDLNREPVLPFEDGIFDAVVVDHHLGVLAQPIEVFREAGRVLATGGICVAGLIHPYFSRDLTRMWALGDDRDHLVLVDSFFEYSNAFSKSETVTVYRRKDQLEWNRLGAVPDSSIRDYIHVAWACKGARSSGFDPFPEQKPVRSVSREEIRYGDDHHPICPYCGRPMGKMNPPVTVFEIDYGVSELYVCFENDCEYYRRSKTWMRAHGQPGYTYRFMLNPANGAIGPIPDNLAGGLASSRVE